MTLSNSTRELPVDRVSSLPDELIHHILSFLDTRHAVQTSILSTRWKHLWKSLPFLNIDRTMFHNSTSFINFVDKVLSLRDDSDIQRFRLYYEDDEDFVLNPQQFYTWICEIVRRNVQELYLDIQNGEQLTLPHCLFTGKSLKILELSIYEWFGIDRFRYTFEIPDSVSLPSLKALHLKNLCFGDENSMPNLLSGCHNLKSLIVENYEIDSLQSFIISAPKLKRLVLWDSHGHGEVRPEGCCKVNIYTPELESFEFLGESEYSSGYHIESCLALDNADINIAIREYWESPDFRTDVAYRKTILDQLVINCLKEVCHVKALTLSDASASLIEFLSESPTILEDLPLKFCNLKYLNLNTWLSRDSIYAILQLLTISPNIGTLVLTIDKGITYVHRAHPWDEKSCSECIGDREVKSSQFVLHHLKFVVMKYVTGCFNEFKILEILLESAAVLETITVYSSKVESSHRLNSLNTFKKNLLTCPRASSCVEILFF